MSYAALDVARYIINYSNKEEYGVSNLKLQKLLYFIQAEYLAGTDEKRPCFADEIEAWDFGPVVPSVYKEYRQYGGSNIPSVTDYYEVNDCWEIQRKKFNDDIIKKEDRDIIEYVVDGLKDYAASALVKITHHQSPWIDAYAAGKNHIISKKAIQEYFESDTD